jgi:putative endonuclease
MKTAIQLSGRLAQLVQSAALTRRRSLVRSQQRPQDAMGAGERKYATYILYSKSRDEYYVGHTQDLLERVEHYHNEGRSLYTKRGIPWKLVYTEMYSTRSEAMRREREIKSRKTTLLPSQNGSVKALCAPSDRNYRGRFIFACNPCRDFLHSCEC